MAHSCLVPDLARLFIKSPLKSSHDATETETSAVRIYRVGQGVPREKEQRERPLGQTGQLGRQTPINLLH